MSYPNVDRRNACGSAQNYEAGGTMSFAIGDMFDSFNELQSRIKEFKVVTSVHTGYVTATADKFTTALTDYFKCEALGHVPGKCSRSKFEQYHTPLMSAIAYTLMGLIPLSFLNYVLKWRSIKEVTVKSFHLLSTKRTTSKVSSSNKMSSISQPKCRFK